MTAATPAPESTPGPVAGPVADPADPASWSATEIAAAVQARRVSAVDVLAAHRDRAMRHADLRALVATDWAAAHQTAERTDRAIAADTVTGPLAGVPVTVKDVIAAAGLPATSGSVALRDNRPTHDATAVSRLRAAGATLIGKTNCPEFAFGTTCESPLFGRTGNPIAPDRSPGGSSGGEAACIATGISALGIGTDYGGSVRWPAQCTGIVSLRPTPGRIPGTGQLPGAGGALGVGAAALPSPASLQGRFQVIGPLARTVDDLELALRVCAGYDGVDPAAPVGAAPASAAVPVAHLRVGWSDGVHIGPVRREIAALLGAVATGIGGQVRTVIQLDKVFAGCLDAYSRLRDLDPLTDHLLAVAGREDAVSPEALRSLRATTAGDPRDRTLAWRDALAARATALTVFDQVDVVLLPVAGGPACWPDGTVDVDGTSVGGWQLMAHCRAVTLLGAPVVTVPVGVSAEGLPLSVQVIAAPWREDIALAAARLLTRTR